MIMEWIGYTVVAFIFGAISGWVIGVKMGQAKATEDYRFELDRIMLDDSYRKLAIAKEMMRRKQWLEDQGVDLSELEREANMPCPPEPPEPKDMN